jgi:hypothetical protein
MLLLTVAVGEARDGGLLDDCCGVDNYAQTPQELLQAQHGTTCDSGEVPKAAHA